MKATRDKFQLLTNQSMTTSFTSPAYSILDIDVQALQVNYSGSPVGSFSVQGSVDHTQTQNPDGSITVTNAGSFATMFFTVNGTTTSSVAVPASASPIIFDIYGSGVEYIQLVYTATSGTGTTNAFMTGKRLGD